MSNSVFIRQESPYDGGQVLQVLRDESEVYLVCRAFGISSDQFEEVKFSDYLTDIAMYGNSMWHIELVIPTGTVYKVFNYLPSSEDEFNRTLNRDPYTREVTNNRHKLYGSKIFYVDTIAGNELDAVAIAMYKMTEHLDMEEK